MNKILKITFVLFLSLTFFACNEDDTKNEINQSEVIAGLIEAKSKMNQVTDKSNLTDIEQIKNKYRSNLEIINNKTGLNLTYDEQEFNSMLSTLDESSLSNGFLISNDNFYQNLEEMNQNGSYDIFNESQEILNTVYDINNGTYLKKRGLSWGCGIALASNFVATLGLSACATGVGCPLAIAGKALALAGVATSCI